MSPTTILALAAAGFSLGLASLGAFRKNRSMATWCFAIGMLIFALENLFGAKWREADVAETAAFWGSLTLVMKALFPGIWICFSLTYSRGSPRTLPLRSRLLILAAFIIPVGISLIFKNQLLPVSPYSDFDANWWVRSHAAARTLNGFQLISAVVVLMNLERTFRSAVGTMQWRIKFIVIGLGIIFGARVYTTSQALLFSEGILVLSGVDSAALLIGCALMVVAFLRSGFGEIDVYPSHAVLRTSVTFVLAGGYLVVVGVLAQVVASTGKAEAFELQTLIVLLAFAGLAIVLLSNRFRQKIRSLVSRHFKRPQYDFRQIWTRVTRSMSSAFGQPAMCAAAAKLISETFNVLSVSIWLLDEDRLAFGASTSRSASEASAVLQDPQQTFARIRMLRKPFELEKAKGDHIEALKQISLNQFRTGGNRICVPLCAGNNCMGIAILADRVGGTPYSIEEFDLLKCIGDQVAVGLLNLRLTDEITSGKELEAFQAMSAFFVHDLKNAASTLSLTLKNLPLHFDDPAFRQDVLRGIGETTERINQLISRLTALRRLELNLAEVDLNSVVDDAVNGMNGTLNVRVMRDFRLQPKVRLDRDQFGSVINNLLLNARDAVGSEGEVKIQTAAENEWAIVSVADNGCGMTPEFVRSSLFRPFQTTKKKGLGIGMFQSKMIVEAHQGRILVKSEPAVGTTFRIMLPLSTQTA
ncbi:MAG TPA: XrtA/PEP-CTERM system histidine kinase PrsK [Candidatus Udaeobacter sp.]|nr:XrtA/PEP-CTERM system histidine kinase PrsK [Candidatus Udaeobacter sp.]